MGTSTLVKPGQQPQDEIHGPYRAGLAYGHFIYRIRWFVFIFWLLATVVSAYFAMQMPGLLSGGGIELQGSESVRVSEILHDKLNTPQSRAVIVFQSSSIGVKERAYQQEIQDVKRKLEGFPKLQSIIDGEIGKDGRTIFLALQFEDDIDVMQQYVPALKAKLPTGDKAQPAQVYLTDGLPVTYEIISRNQEDVKQADTIALPILLLILLVVFGTLVAASMPILVAIIAIPTALALVYPLALHMSVSSYLVSVSSIIGLGASIDYSLILVRRFREELAKGRSVEDAIAWMIATAGEAILFSGLLVIVGFLSLLFIGMSITSSIGIGGAAVIISSVLAALTLLPALLGIIGHRINSLRIPLLWRLTMPSAGSTYDNPNGFWHRLALFVMKRPLVTILLVCTLLALLGWPTFFMQVGTGGINGLPASSESRLGLDILKAQYSDQFSYQQVSVLAQTDDRSGILQPENLRRIAELDNWLLQQPHVKRVTSLMHPPAIEGARVPAQEQLIILYSMGIYKQNPALVQLVEATVKDNLALINVSADIKEAGNESKDFIKHLRTDGSGAVANIDIMVGGTQAMYLDFDDFLYGNFPKAIGFIMIATFILLLLMFRSILIPIKAIVMNILSISATYGVLVFIFQWGNFSDLLGFKSPGYVDDMIPILLFCILFGLSMDYEVFLLNRVREEWLRTHNNTLAVACGLEKTGSVITNAALLFMVITFTFVFTSLIILKEIGIGMTVALLVDATIIRSLLVPATMHLLGRWNWWFPGRPLPPERRTEM